MKPDEYYMHVMDCIVFQQTVLAVNVSLMFAKDKLSSIAWEKTKAFNSSVCLKGVVHVFCAIILIG